MDKLFVELLMAPNVVSLPLAPRFLVATTLVAGSRAASAAISGTWTSPLIESSNVGVPCSYAI